MWVKICGTTNLEDALVAVEAGADAVGFIFAESKRRVSPGQVAEITRHLPASVEKYGVFTTQEPGEILSVVQEAGLTGVQLHSAFSPELVRTLRAGRAARVDIMQVLDVPAHGPGGEELNEDGASFDAQLRKILTGGAVDRILLDTAVRGTSGGTGLTFDWKRAHAIVSRAWPAETTCQLVLAGGLRAENLQQAKSEIRVDGVDVASGVEAHPGKKDAARVRGFVQAARR